MKKLALLFLLLAAHAFATTYVAVLEAVSENGELGQSERFYLTDKLRERAGKVLPSYMDYVIMTRENISAMLPPNKSIEECYGTCLAETGQNISADYVSGTRVGKFGNQYTLTVELYETRKSKLIGSFSTRKPDAEALLAEVERQADALFSKILNDRGGMFGTAGGENAKSYDVTIETSPARAMVSVDGKPKCNATPCKVKIAEGSHQLSLALDEYFEKDTLVEVGPTSRTVSVGLDPKFGVLVVMPRMAGGYGDVDEVGVTVDGQPMNGAELRLAPGKHEVRLEHRCYEPVSFTVGVQSGSRVTFDRDMRAATGGLRLSARRDGQPVEVGVSVDGRTVGDTPFYDKVPLCGKVSAGGVPVDVELRYHETVDHTQEL